MEIAKAELAAIEVVATKNEKPVLSELSDLQLALVGGGVGEVVLA